MVRRDDKERGREKVRRKRRVQVKTTSADVNDKVGKMRSCQERSLTTNTASSGCLPTSGAAAAT